MFPEHKQAVEFWAAAARDALDTAEKLYATAKYHHALFFCHLAVEKALKASYIARHVELPPYTHDLVLLASKIPAVLPDDDLSALKEINTFSIEARYEEEKRTLYHRATTEYARMWLDRCAAILHALDQ